MVESKNFKIELDDEGYLGIKLKSVFVESMFISIDQIDELIETLTKYKNVI